MVEKPIEPATLEWQGDVPFAPLFGDVYFSREGGIAETEHVFLSGNKLPERWKNQPHFTILETGFGTGLNFLCTAQSWQQHRNPGQFLYYISIEKHPIPVRDMERLHTGLPPFATKLRAALPPAIPGFHWHVFEEEQIALLLIYADIETALSELEAKIDAWFLDGFAPAKNPDMWGDALFHAMQTLSAPGATFATYTAASAVRAGVTAAGFEWQRVPGFGHKKHMLCGQKTPPHESPSSCGLTAGSSGAARLDPAVKPQDDDIVKTAIVIGGGLAGSSVAAALARHKYKVTLMERHAELAEEASGNPAAILKPYLAKMWAAQTLLYNQAFYFARQQAVKAGLFHATGALQLDEEPRHAELKFPASSLQEVTVSAASELSGVAVKRGGVWLPEGGWMHPKSFCEAVLKSPQITRIMSTEALTISRTETGWNVNDLWEASTLVIANAKDAISFPQLAHLPLIPMRGQITMFKKTLPLKTILSYGGYALPHDDCITLGATYDRRDMEANSREEDNLKNISEYNNAVATPMTGESIGARVAWRTTTPSKRPIVGKIEEGLYVSLGLGSRGAALAPYLAEQIAAEIMGTPQPLQKSAKTLLSKY